MYQVKEFKSELSEKNNALNDHIDYFTYYRELLGEKVILQYHEQVYVLNEPVQDFEITAGSSDQKKANLVIQTDDYVRDYYKLKQDGVEVPAIPQYTTFGLSAGFCDHFGNSCLLVEHRNYNLKVVL